MENVLSTTLDTIAFGPAQAHGGVTVFPLVDGAVPGREYLTLTEALDAFLLEVTEVSAGGRVPELKVLNQSPRPVLLLDGEELCGAKQNRVLNTTVLLKEHSETLIPVSCTEQGRWSWQGPRFSDSGYVMPCRLRGVKNASVDASLRSRHSYDSDQGAVWSGIRTRYVGSRVHSPTGALRDACEANREDLDRWLTHFPCLPGQNGLVVFLGESAAGVDRVSSPRAYALLHGKLVRSYLMDALSETLPGKGVVSPESARAFLREARACESRAFPSVGHGTDLRCRGRSVVGSALVYEGAVIHLAFFRVDGAEQETPYPSWSRRRGFRV